MSERIRLTPELTKEIAAAIRAGGYPHVAADAFGVPKDVFDDWLQRGNQKNAWDPYRSFALEVRKAFAQARLRAEAASFEKDPKLWLVHGPGRETDGQPGWSVPVKPTDVVAEGHNALLDPQLMALFRTVMDVLRPYPDACTKVAEALIKAGVQPKSEGERDGAPIERTADE
jgi:hypothetical protein